MPALDWSQCPAVESVPGRLSGAWVFRNTRMPVSTVFENLKAGASIEEIMDWYDVARDQILAVLELLRAAWILQCCQTPIWHPSMRILFDHNIPAPLAAFLQGHSVIKAKDAGWDTLDNGDLIAAAEQSGFEVLIAGDKNIRYQQNLRNRKIAIVVLSSPQWPAVQRKLEAVITAVNCAIPGAYISVEIPYD